MKLAPGGLRTSLATAASSYLGGAEVVGLLWYLLHLRPRIVRWTAGVARKQAAESEESAIALS